MATGVVVCERHFRVFVIASSQEFVCAVAPCWGSGLTKSSKSHVVGLLFFGLEYFD